MVGLATITLSTSSVRAEETTDQSSYPLKSENAIPLGDCSEYLSCAWSCAEMTAAPTTASTATANAIVSLLLRPMTDSFSLNHFHFGLSDPRSLARSVALACVMAPS